MLLEIKDTQRLNGISHRSYRHSLAPPGVIHNVPCIFVGIEEIGVAKLEACR